MKSRILYSKSICNSFPFYLLRKGIQAFSLPLTFHQIAKSIRVNEFLKFINFPQDFSKGKYIDPNLFSSLLKWKWNVIAYSRVSASAFIWISTYDIYFSVRTTHIGVKDTCNTLFVLCTQNVGSSCCHLINSYTWPLHVLASSGRRDTTVVCIF